MPDSLLKDAAEDGGRYRRWIQVPVASGIFLALVMGIIAGMATASLSVKRAAFCAPAANLAGLLSGAPCVKDEED